MDTVAIIGTRAQAIKMAPVVRALRARRASCEIVLTGQHETTIDELLADFELAPDVRLWSSGEVKSIARGLSWTPRLLFRTWSYLRRRARTSPITVLVHGDTMTTLIGALAGRFARLKVAHVEAGLRSGALLDPFPEELIRRFVTHITRIAYCPGEDAVAHARGRRRRCIDTGENTVLDAVRWALAHTKPDQTRNHDEPYVIVSAHRVETVLRPHRLQALHDLVLEVARDIKVQFVLHPVTRARLERAHLLNTLDDAPNVVLMPRMGYIAFVQTAARAHAILTDGGGNQEEMSYLGVRTLILRQHTERPHGLGSTTILVGLNVALVRAHIESTDGRGHPMNHLSQFAHCTPAECIAKDLLAR